MSVDVRDAANERKIAIRNASTIEVQARLEAVRRTHTGVTSCKCAAEGSASDGTAGR
jgi:hypothetical protein